MDSGWPCKKKGHGSLSGSSVNKGNPSRRRLFLVACPPLQQCSACGFSHCPHRSDRATEYASRRVAAFYPYGYYGDYAPEPVLAPIWRRLGPYQRVVIATPGSTGVSHLP